MSARDITALVIGCGSIGRRHARNLAGIGVADLLLFDPNVERARQAANESRGRAVDDLPEALAAERGVALVCSPPALHEEQVAQALKGGWDVFVEKPVTPSAARADALARLAAEREAVTLVGFNFRFEPGLLEVERLLRAGSLGAPLAVRGIVGQYLPDWHPWEDYRHGYSARRELGGGVLLDNSHEIDTLVWLFGDPVSVWCQARTTGTLDIDSEDVAQLSLAFADGPLAQLQLDYLQRAPRRELEIACSGGTIRWLYDQRRLDVYFEGEWTSTALREDHNLTYVDELEHLLTSVSTRARTRCTLAEGARSLRVVEGAKRSAGFA